MSFKDCIQKGLKGVGGLTEKQSKDLIRDYEDLVKKYTETLGDPAAADKAAQDFIQGKQAQVIAENEAKIKHALFQKRHQKDIELKLKDQTDAYNKMPKAQQKISRKPSVHHVVGDLYESIDVRTKTIARTEALKLVDFYNEHGSKLLGLSQKTEQLPNIVKSMLGEDVSHPLSKKFGNQIAQVFDSLHVRYTQAGGLIGKITNYFPQVHNPQILKETSFDEWSEYILPRLDRDKMIDYDTGLPMSDSRLMDQMKGDYEAITTNGLSELAERVDEGLVTRGLGGDVFKRKQQSRFYQFKDANSFLEYNEKFGVGNHGLFDAIGSHIHSMARDIALMEKMGPKPNAMARYFDVLMESKGVGQNSRNFVNGMYGLASGRLSDFGTLPIMYRFLEGSKALVRFFLGGAVISALPDAAFVKTSLKVNGYKQGRAMATYFNGINPASKVNQRSMQRYTMVMSGLQGQTLEGARYTDSLGYDGGKVVQSIGFLSSMILRASGLTRLTDQGKMSVMSAVMGEFAENSIQKIPYNKLNSDFKSTLKRFNITPEDYDIILRAKPFIDETTKGSFITSADILDVPNVPTKDKIRIAANYEDMITRMADLATNEPTLTTRAITTGAAVAPETAKTGTALRGVMGALMSFKGFPITVTRNFILPIARNAMSGKRSNIMTAVEVLGYTTILGAMSYQAKTLMRGEEARDMEDPKFWMAAAMQGGGLGLFGDFLFDDYSRFGHSLAESLAGPVVSTYSDAFRIINGNYNRALEDGTETKFLADTWKFGSKFIPGATLWYARLPLERTLIDGVSSVLDPDYDKKIRQREKRLQKKEGRGYWWRPNSGLEGAL